MKIVIDTNIIIDAVAARVPFCEGAQQIMLMVSEEEFAGYITANSITDIFYVIRRSVSELQAREIIRSLLYSLEIIEVNGSDCLNALRLQMPDFEDALLATCAEKIGADYIVSRDAVFTKANSPVPVVTPSEFLSSLNLI